MKLNRILTALLLLLVLGGCKKEEVYTYDVNDVTVRNDGAYKPNIKSDLEFITIAYTDLFGTTIAPDKLESMALAYNSFGDKRLVIDMIILNLLNEPGVVIPTDASMRADVEGFVRDCFRKFYVREPNAFEAWWVRNKIANDASLTPDLVYYSFMTSEEYRFY